jgi:antitoxin component YwqK of YwqJK toxin-antitoxin module
MKPKYTTVLLLSFFLFSCNDMVSNNEKYYNSGTIKELVISDKKMPGIEIVYSFYETGGIKEIHRYNEKKQLHGEQFWFFDNGILEKKMPIYEDKAKGNAYYFYPNNGALKNDRYFRNDKQVFYGADYWGDSMGTMKASLHFNDNGEVYYKKNFDENGKFINEEGKKE